jgi:hypothetical protein
VNLPAPAPALDTRWNRTLAFLLGLLLPVLTLRTAYVGTPRDLLSRIVPVDLLCLAFLAVLVTRHALRPVPLPGVVYLFGIVLSAVPGLLVTAGPEVDVWWPLSAALMAFGFYVLGLNLGASPGLLRALLAGSALAVLAETVVVYHDFLSPAPWFPDPMRGRARGTFKANGQLGAYGWCAAGLLATFGATVAAPRLRTLLVLAALAAATFPFPASRRTGMFCVFLWAVLFLALGARFAGRGPYRLLAGAVLGTVLALAVAWGHLAHTFFGKRVTDAARGFEKRDNFIEKQHRNALRTLPEWFPFGFGVGKGYRIDPRDGHEVHNGLLAVLVEQGVLGLAGFAAMVLAPLAAALGGRRNDPEALFGAILASFLLASLVFMIHNTLYRDRTFQLYLGLAAAMTRREAP